MEQHGDWKPGDPFEPAFIKFLDELFPAFDEKDRCAVLIRAFAKDPKNEKVTLKEVSFIKLGAIFRNR